jgi:hypothetical protein
MSSIAASKIYGAHPALSAIAASRICGAHPARRRYRPRESAGRAPHVGDIRLENLRHAPRMSPIAASRICEMRPKCRRCPSRESAMPVPTIYGGHPTMARVLHPSLRLATRISARPDFRMRWVHLSVARVEHASYTPLVYETRLENMNDKEATRAI